MRVRIACPLCRGSDDVSEDRARAYIELVERNAILRDRLELTDRELKRIARRIPTELREELQAIRTRMIGGSANLRSPDAELLAVDNLVANGSTD